MEQETIPRPPGIRDAVFTNEYLYRDYGNIISAYDPVEKIGAMYNKQDGEWISFYPIERDEYARRVAAAIDMFEKQNTTRSASH